MTQITTSSQRKVGIVGGGIGGLTAALALLKRGFDVEVYEQSNLLKEVGAGVQIGSNGTRVLYALGLEDALSRIQVLPARREIRHWRTGETWNWFELAQQRQQLTPPSMSSLVGGKPYPTRASVTGDKLTDDSSSLSILISSAVTQ